MENNYSVPRLWLLKQTEVYIENVKCVFLSNLVSSYEKRGERRWCGVGGRT
jgi:hypothetical protein